MAEMNPDSNRRGAYVKENIARLAMDEKARQNSANSRIPGAESGVVVAYDFANQRVSVNRKDAPHLPTLENVPILGPSSVDGTSRDVFPLPAGTVGLLIPLHRDASMSFGDREMAPAYTPRLNRGDAWVFYPGEPKFDDEALPDWMDPAATVDDIDKVGPDDRCIGGPGGSRFIFKSDGGITIIGKWVKAGRFTDDPANFDDITRDIDTT